MLGLHSRMVVTPSALSKSKGSGAEGFGREPQSST